MSLREPFFLRGKQSRLVRASWMSMALGGIGFVVGTAWFGGAWLFVEYGIGGFSEDQMFATLAASTGVTLAAVSLLYSRWCGSALPGTIGRACVMACVPTAPWLAGLSSKLYDAGWYRPLRESYRGLEDRFESDFDALSGQFVILFFFTSLWLAWTAGCFRPARAWLLMSGLSLLAVPLMMASINVFDGISSLFRAWGLAASVVEVLEIVSICSLGGQFLAALLIPWGFPFWWPEVVANTLDAAAGARDSASAFSAGGGLGT